MPLAMIDSRRSTRKMMSIGGPSGWSIVTVDGRARRLALCRIIARAARPAATKVAGCAGYSTTSIDRKRRSAMTRNRIPQAAMIPATTTSGRSIAVVGTSALANATACVW